MSLILPKWLNKWLTPEEESQLRDPSRRVFTFGLLASVASLALPTPPPLVEFPDAFVWQLGTRLKTTTTFEALIVDAFDSKLFDDAYRRFPVYTLQRQPKC